MPNSYVNKVQYVENGTPRTLIDLTSDTVTAAALMQGYTAHDASGAPITGTASGGVEDGHVYQDGDGYLVLSDETGKVYQAKTNINPSTSSQTITPDAGYDALSSVQVNAMPSGAVSASASKGSVSNHAISVTPTATVGTAGYLAAGSTNGTAVTVSASELVSGDKSITANGTNIDVANYATVSVAVDSGAKYTATITRTSGTNIPRVQVNGTGTTYSANNDTFTFSPGDYLDFYLGSSDWDSNLFVNGQNVFQNSYGHYSYYPGNDVQIVFSVGNYTSETNITTPYVPTLTTKSVTANGTYNASSDSADGYSSVTVNVTPTGMSESQLKDFISRNSTFTDITWPSGITTIGSYAFAYCVYFNPSSLPSGITSIKSYAFYYCQHLDLSSLPSGLKTIENHAFDNCPELALTSLPNTVTSIYSYAFYYCTSLALTSLPSSVTRIDSYAFAYCSSLALTSLPNGITSIGQSTFQGCTSLALTSLPANLDTIGSSAFSGCTSLALTSLPSSVTRIDSNAFVGCTGLTSISCDGVITAIGYPIFTGNSSNPTMHLTSASFPNMALTSNMNYVFGNTTAAYACQLLEFCDIGSTVGIGSNAFANCYSLTKLVLRKTESVCTLNNVSAFTNTPMRGYNNLTGTVYVPSALISSYQTASNWSTLYNNGTVTFAAIEGSDYDLS